MQSASAARAIESRLRSGGRCRRRAGRTAAECPRPRREAPIRLRRHRPRPPKPVRDPKAPPTGAQASREWVVLWDYYSERKARGILADCSRETWVGVSADAPRSVSAARSLDADVIVVGAGLAGLVATAELTDAGCRVIVVDQEPEASLGGQAFWSFGGLFLVNSPEQRRLGVHDSYELAHDDWMGAAALRSRGRQLAAALGGGVPGLCRRREAGLAPWARGPFLSRRWLGGARGLSGDGARQLGASLSRDVGDRSWRARAVRAPGAREAQAARARHAEVPVIGSMRSAATTGLVDGVHGDVLEPSDVERGCPSSRTRVGEFALRAQAVVVTSGGIGANHDLVRQNAGPHGWALRRKRMLSGVPDLRGRTDARDCRSGGRAFDQCGPDVALSGGHSELCADLEWLTASAS